jgi:hypothetical protein
MKIPTFFLIFTHFQTYYNKDRFCHNVESIDNNVIEHLLESKKKNINAVEVFVAKIGKQN